MKRSDMAEEKNRHPASAISNRQAPQPKAASGNRCGFFYAAPCRKWQFRLSMYPDPKHRAKK
jgi:hypothetical protein